jgi:glycosyltransferase involved in cell wall biosynthesis
VKVLFTSASLLADYGGPAFSITALARSLANLGVRVGVWAADQSAVNSPLLDSESSVERILGAEQNALKFLTCDDVLHDSGIWMPHNHRLAILAKKWGIARVVSTRGMLQPWALGHKRVRKSFAWNLYQRRDLKLARYHHTTSESEARNLHKLALNVPIVTIPNGVDVPPPRTLTEPAASRQPKIALFLGRIYPIKGLPLLIEAWSRVRPQDWVLRIVGPDEAGHRKQIENNVRAAGLDQVVSFTGAIAPRMKPSLFNSADLLILPSYSESFGMVVAEALAHGLPVLTTTGTPWSSLPRNGCGWYVEPTLDAIASALHAATILDRAALRTMGAKGRALAINDYSWPHVAHRFLSLYESVLSTSLPDAKAEFLRTWSAENFSASHF